jgi:hypothetical protein
VHDVGPGHVLEELAADMAGRAVARRSVGELARIALRVLDQGSNVGERRLGRRGEKHVSSGDQRDGLQVAFDVVRQLLHHVARDRQRADRPHADCVAVGRALRHGVDADGQGAARAVVDDYGLAELLRHLRRHQPRDVVGRAAGRLRHDEAQRPLRVPVSNLSCRCRREEKEP